jgi:hypothetical protein
VSDLTMPWLYATLPLGSRARLVTERCAACGANPGKPCRVAYGKGPTNAKPSLILGWAHAQRAEAALRGTP